MKKLTAVLMAIMLVVCGCIAAHAEPKKPDKDIVILFTSDIHCGTDKGLGIGAMIEAKKHFAKDNHVLLADLGDAMQGGISGMLTQGRLIASLLNLVRYDIATAGNHDFDFGAEDAGKLFEMSGCQHVCVNVLADGEPALPPYVIKDIGGTKVAFVGALTPTVAVNTNQSGLVDAKGRKYTFAADEKGDELAKLIQKAVDGARADGADYVILLAHLGNDKADEPYTSESIIKKTSGIDAVLDGHSHDTDYAEYKDKDGRTVIRQATGTQMQAIGYLRIGKDGKLSMGLIKDDGSELSEQLKKNENCVTVIHDLVNIAVEVLQSEQIGTSDAELKVFGEKKADGKETPRIIRLQETNMGDLIADSFRSISGADVAVINSGSIRAEIKKGPVTIKDMLDVQPYMNPLAMCECTGQDILNMLEMSVKDMPKEFGGFLQVSGITFDVRTDIPTPVILDKDGNYVDIKGDRRISNVVIGGKPIDPNGKYKIVSTKGILHDGVNGYAPIFKDHLFLEWDAPFDGEAIKIYITDKLKGKLGEGYTDPNGQGRINVIGAANASGSGSGSEADKKAA